MVVTTKPLTIAHARDLVREDVHPHIEDDLRSDPIVNAIRNNKLVEVFWSQLTEDEQRSAYCNMFSIY